MDAQTLAAIAAIASAVVAVEGLPGLVEEVAADRVTIAVLDPVTRKRIARVAVPALAIRTVWSQAERRRLG